MITQILRQIFRIKQIHYLLLFSILMACNSGNDPVKQAEHENDENFSHDKAETADFLVYAADLHIYEIKMGELALGNAGSESMRELGKTMISDHKKSLAELKKLADQRHITLPENEGVGHRKDCEKIGGKTGREFDKDFCDLMESGHKDAIWEFEHEANFGKEEEIKQWAFNTLPTLNKHLDMAVECKTMLENPGSDSVAVSGKDEEKGKGTKARSKPDEKTGKTRKADW